MKHNDTLLFNCLVFFLLIKCEKSYLKHKESNVEALKFYPNDFIVAKLSFWLHAEAKGGFFITTSNKVGEMYASIKLTRF